MEAGGGRIEVGRVFSEVFSIYGAQAGPLLGSAAFVVGFVGILNGALAAQDSIPLSLLGTAIEVVAQVLYTGFVVRLVEDVRDGRRDHRVADLFSAAAPAVGPLILNGLLYAIGVFAGFLLLVIPGLILITIWAVTAPSIVIERAGPVEAFGRSRELVRGNGWPVFGTIIVATLINAVVALLALVIAGGSDGGVIVASAIAAIATAPILGLVSSILFFDLGGGDRAAIRAGASPLS
jgi:hypothetical protein